MKISTKGRYALRLMIELGKNNSNELIALKDISLKQEISIKYLEQIVSQLSKSGFLKSNRGPQGGYKLSKSPKEYTVGSILRVTEGGISPVACLEDDINQCKRYNKCETINFWKGLYKVINEYVDSITLYDLIIQEKDK